MSNFSFKSSKDWPKPSTSSTLSSLPTPAPRRAIAKGNDVIAFNMFTNDETKPVNMFFAVSKTFAAPLKSITLVLARKVTVHFTPSHNIDKQPLLTFEESAISWEFAAASAAAKAACSAFFLFCLATESICSL